MAGFQTLSGLSPVNFDIVLIVPNKTLSKLKSGSINLNFNGNSTQKTLFLRKLRTMTNGIIILDFGSQYNQLIARRIREFGVYAEILPFHASLDEILSKSPKGIILSGGPSSVSAENAALVDKALYEQNIPVLGICYGMQLTAHLLGG